MMAVLLWTDPMKNNVPCLFLAGFLATACTQIDHLGRPPSLSGSQDTPEHVAMLGSSTPHWRTRHSHPSLWSGGPQSLLGDRRAMRKGDILTVVMEIDERAEISNDTTRQRSGSESLSVPDLFGLPQRAAASLPDGASMSPAVSIDSTSQSTGRGTVKRNEKLTLRLAATVVDVLPNGTLSIAGSQELRVNFELRALTVTGYVRPEDITRQNEITYDKIAAARVSYGGRGDITATQQPRLGQQILDLVLPF